MVHHQRRKFAFPSPTLARPRDIDDDAADVGPLRLEGVAIIAHRVGRPDLATIVKRLNGIDRRRRFGDLLGLFFLRLLGELRGGGDGHVAVLDGGDDLGDRLIDYSTNCPN